MIDTWFNLKGGFRIEVAATTGSGASVANVDLGLVEVVGMRGDSGLTPKSSSAEDKGNRSPGLS
jgi:hypothetical protein